MSKVLISSNSNAIPSTFSHSLEKIDWKTTACASLILGAAGLIAYQMLYGRFFSWSASYTFRNAKLNFTDQRLGRIISFLQSPSGEKHVGPWIPEEVNRLKPELVNWEFKEVLRLTLKILDENDNIHSQQIIFTKDNRKHKQIFEFLDFGVGGKYEDSKLSQHKSWVNKILVQLCNENYIASFSIEADKIIIQKTLK